MSGDSRRHYASPGGFRVEKGTGYLDLDDAALLAQCAVDTYRASGPGGQKRNKTSSAVRLRHGPTGLSVVATESRSQHENRARALRRLRRAIALRIRRPVDPQTYRPGAVLAECLRGDGRLSVTRRDPRYDHVVAEVLDVLDACDMRVSSAAARIGITTANLVAFLQSDGAVWGEANRMRTAAGLKPLHR